MIGFLEGHWLKGKRRNNSIFKLVNELQKTRAWALYWMANTLVNLGVYYRDSIGRNMSYCNVAAYDFFDSRCNVVWNVNVQIGNSVRESFPMGNVIRTFDFDISPILRDHRIKNVLNTAPDVAYYNTLRAVVEKEVRLLDSETAQRKANAGIPSMIIHPALGSQRIGHLAIVIPNLNWIENEWVFEKYDPKVGCKTVNIGWENGIMYVDDMRGFGSFLNPNTLELLPEVDGDNVRAIIVEFRDYKSKEYLNESSLK